MPSQLVNVGGKLIDPNAQLIDLDRQDCEESFYEFYRHAWSAMDAQPWKDGWCIQVICEHLEAVVDGQIRNLLINLPPRVGKSSICSVAFPAWVWTQQLTSPTSGPSVPFLHASYSEALAIRDSVRCRRLIESKWYQERWGKRFQLTSDQNTKSRFQNSKGGERFITSVEKRITGEGGNVIIIDDPNASNEVNAEAAKIQETLDWWNETMSTRLNDQGTGAFVVIQQRLAENDLSGHILETEADDWVHLMLPLEYEPERAFSTSIGWKDPRTQPGEILWPERFSERSVKTLKKRLGTFGCNPCEAPILMSDLSMKKIEEIKPGDEIVGFERRENGGRNKLTKAIVTEVHSRKAPIVRMTLDSGEVIRCTPDHRWFRKDRGPDREMYLPAIIGTDLARVSLSRMPRLNEDEIRDAGWLAGFFDGEGTISLCKRDQRSQKDGREYEPSARICFYQGSGRNKPNCEKLERILTQFGFRYGYTEDQRKGNKDAACYGYRAYTIKTENEGLIAAQKFLHMIRPVKWRQRLIDSCYKSNYIARRERVVKIEPAGEETVYALTTTTGNYVVWGFLSSNSAGQLQQRPEPPGGGIIKREWWINWEEEHYPQMDFIIGLVDTAYTEKTQNDPSGMIVLGVFTARTSSQVNRMIGPDGGILLQGDRQEREGAPKVMLMDAWTERLEFNDLVQRVHRTASRKEYRIDMLVIENKAAGHSIAQEIRRVYSHELYSVVMYDPKSADKMSRLYSVQPIFEDEIVYAPNTIWAEAVISQCGVFPRGKHDEYVDCISMGLRKLRDMGLIARSDERIAEMEEEMARNRTLVRTQPLYPG